MRLHPLALLALVPLCASMPAAQRFSFRAEKGLKLEKTFESRLGLDLDQISISIGGEEIPAEDLGAPEIQIDSVDRLVFVDEFPEGSDGRPKSFTRKFVELESREVQSTSSEGESESETSEEESDLEGKTVRFTWSDEEDAFQRKYEGDGADDELLAGLVEDCDLRGCLPDGDVSEGDTWELEASAFDLMMSPGGELGLVDPDDEDESDDIDGQLRENLTGKLRATFKGLREEDGVKVAILVLEGELETKAETSEQASEGHSSSSSYEIDFDVEGEILWDLAAGRAHAFSLQAKVEAHMAEQNKVEFEGQAFEMSQKLVFVGQLDCSGSWAVAE